MTPKQLDSLLRSKPKYENQIRKQLESLAPAGQLFTLTSLIDQETKAFQYTDGLTAQSHFIHTLVLKQLLKELNTTGRVNEATKPSIREIQTSF